MIFRALAKRQPSTPEVLRASALRSALILRDCSFRAQSSIAASRLPHPDAAAGGAMAPSGASAAW